MIPYDKLYIYQVNGKVSHGNNEFPPDYIGTWWEGEHSFLFFSQEAERTVQTVLEEEPSLRLIDQFTIDYRDWQGGDEIAPFRVGKMVFIPSWVEMVSRSDEIPIILDPSVVFGTGLHPSTRGCLEMLGEVYERERPQRVLDLGTGTGILALACAKLGALRILAIDHNPLAVKTAEKNVGLNHEESHIDVVKGDAEDLVYEPCDLVCCNLPYQVLDRLLGTEAFFQKRWCILSGFFERDVQDVTQKLRRRGVRLEMISQRGSYGLWQTILGFNQDASA